MKPKKIIILGSTGQVGTEISKKLKNLKLLKLSSKKFDYLKKTNLKSEIIKFKPDVIINASAYTNVDLAGKQRNKCLELNYYLPKYLSKLCYDENIILIHFSTDYVYDGKKNNNQQISETDKTNPLNYYGYSKLLGDNAVLKNKCYGIIFRVGWVYGNSENNFINKIIKFSKKNSSITIVKDQIGTPTSAGFIAHYVNKYLKARKFEKIKVFNLSPKGKVNRYNLVKFFLKNRKINIKSILTKNLDTQVHRPLNTSLNSSNLFKKYKWKRENWKFYLEKYLKQNN